MFILCSVSLKNGNRDKHFKQMFASDTAGEACLRPCRTRPDRATPGIMAPTGIRTDIYQHHADRYHELVSAEDRDGNLWPVLERLVDWEDALVLEAGVGTGRVTRLCIEQARRAVCCDVSAHMLEFARSALSDVEDKIEIVEASNLALPKLNEPVYVFIEGWSFGHAASLRHP